MLIYFTGLVGYHPPFPNQPEDEMSTTAVQGGLQTKDPVGVRNAPRVESERSADLCILQAPTWGTKDIANRSLAQESALSDLQGLFNQVFARKADVAAPIPYVRWYSLRRF